MVENNLNSKIKLFEDKELFLVSNTAKQNRSFLIIQQEEK